MSLSETDHVARVEQEGFTIVENAIEPPLLDVLAADLERLEAELGARTRAPRRTCSKACASSWVSGSLLGHIDKCSPVDLLDVSPPRRVIGE